MSGVEITPINVEPQEGDAVISSGSGRVLLNTKGQLSLFGTDERRQEALERALKAAEQRIAVLEDRGAFSTTAAVGFRESEQGIPSGVQTVIKLNKHGTDPFNRFNISTGAYIVPQDGFYQCDGNFLLQTVGTAECLVLASIFNGATKVIGGLYNPVKHISGETGSVVSGMTFCKAGDEILLAGFQSSGLEQKTFVSGGGDWNRLSVHRVA